MKRKSGRNHGEVFTEGYTAAYILDQVGYCAEVDLRYTKILEPACGSGAFALLIIQRLYLSSKTFGFSFLNAAIENIQLVEQNEVVYNQLVHNVNSKIKELVGQPCEIGENISLRSNFLLTPFEQKFHCIVGNPPYIRHERIPEADKNTYRHEFNTFRYRADLYVPFFEKALSLLKGDGKLSFVCSNRWLNNQYGEGLRNLIASKYNLKKLLNLEKASLFDEMVLAYPCITVIENSLSDGNTLFFESDQKDISFENLHFSQVASPKDGAWQQLFIAYDLESEKLESVQGQGFQIGIGVATGADSVFIIDEKNSDEIEKSRLLPILKAADVKGDRLKWGGSYLINPYESTGLCDLTCYPKMKAYFEAKREILCERHTAKNNLEKWYKTIDRVKPELLKRPKLLLPDLAGAKWFFIDEGLFYPHHNLYYITGQNSTELKLLATLLMSDLVREQLFCLGIRMHDGFPRLQSQVLKKIRVPRIVDLLPEERRDLLKAYEEKNLPLINEVIESYCNKYQVKSSINSFRIAI